MPKLLLFLMLLQTSITFAQHKTDASVLAYPQTAFDSDTCCWRMLSKEGKYDEGAQLIISYLKHGKAKNRMALKWHTGQLFASGENHRMAKRYFRKTTFFVFKFVGEDAATWYYYVKGSIAFENRNKRQLLRIIHKWDKKKYEKDINYRALNNLYKNWDMKYKDAN